jgi:hypothetical protein
MISRGGWDELGEARPEGEGVVGFVGAVVEGQQEPLDVRREALEFFGGQPRQPLDGEGRGGEPGGAVGPEHPAQPVGVALDLGEACAANGEGVEVRALKRFPALDTLIDGGSRAAHEPLGVGGALEGEGSLDHLDQELERPVLPLHAGAAQGLFLGGVGGAAVGAAAQLFGVGGLASGAVPEKPGALGDQGVAQGDAAEDELLGPDADPVAIGEAHRALDGAVVDP